MVALNRLFKGDKPPRREIRCKNSSNFFYGFGDASGTSFGSTFEKRGFVEFEYGQWCSQSSEGSLNWRELKNVVEAIKGFVKRHRLVGSEIFLFTDNSSAEAAFWKGSSTLEKLFDLVLELRKLEMDHSLHLHVVHVSGKRMIQQGTDGLSRGEHSQGSMNKESLRAFIPLHQSAFERSPKLYHWMREVTKGLGMKYLKPNQWFEQCHHFGNFVWTLPLRQEKSWWSSWQKQDGSVLNLSMW
mmetsp:Transcript_5647/g.8673  ORF Transcript_5647/g.8673 Transcript_5647/m.8673 type:complete len:242 (+) Transcript_5647:1148-1873(+)